MGSRAHRSSEPVTIDASEGREAGWCDGSDGGCARQQIA